MIVVMAASGNSGGVRSPKHVWCFSEADARQATDVLTAEYRAQDAMEVFSMDFPDVDGAALRDAAWRKTAEDCTRIALAMYLKHKQAPERRQTPGPAEEREKPRASVPLQRAA